jgi:hypothetical protein
MRKIALLFVLSISISAVKVVAQTSQTVPPVRFGHLESQNATIDQVLAFPRVVVMNPTCTIAGFSLVIIPKGKDIIGPFKTEGGKLTEDEINLIKKYNTENTRIIIEDVRIKYGDKEVKGNDIIVNIIKGK